MCKIISLRKKNIFSFKFASEHVKCISVSPDDLFPLNVQTLIPQKAKINWNWLFIRKKNVSPDVEHLDAKIAVLTSLFNYFNQNPKSFVQCDMIISQIKSFEVKNRFTHLFFCQRRLLFWQPCMSFSNKNPKKRKWTFFGENNFIESVYQEGNNAFLTIVPGKIW